ncbi:hypothetical protein ACFU6I_36080 [Streptomyces sp. NPDC057486]|uniref:hypothetical protein n=1 Tax=Streptomyces sp. NPDC057486 TaxID=3346145 RepID=UPI00367CB9F6
MGDGRQRAFVGRQTGPNGSGQRGDTGLASRDEGLRRLLGLGVGRLAGFQGDCVRGQRARFQRCGEAGDQVFVGQVAAEEEDFDQGAGALAFAVGLHGGLPPGVVDGGEAAGGAGLVEGGGAGQGTRFPDQGLQVVVEFKAGSAAGDEPFMPARSPANG